MHLDGYFYGVNRVKRDAVLGHLFPLIRVKSAMRRTQAACKCCSYRPTWLRLVYHDRLTFLNRHRPNGWPSVNSYKHRNDSTRTSIRLGIPMKLPKPVFSFFFLSSLISNIEQVTVKILLGGLFEILHYISLYIYISICS